MRWYHFLTTNHDQPACMLASSQQQVMAALYRRGLYVERFIQYSPLTKHY